MGIPVCKPTLGGNEAAYAYDCLSSNWISSGGKYIEQFENVFSKWCGVKYGVSCTSGTAALHLAVTALGIGKGDEVIMPSFTIVSCANAVVYNGATPVFIDSDMETRNMDVRLIEKMITPKTKAIMVVHTYGNPVDMDPVMKIAKKHKLYIIEDAAEAHGAAYKGKKVGSFGDIACFSFYANKIITTGEGGMCVTNSEHLYKKMNSLKNLCFTHPRFYHEEIGFNYRMTNIQAAIGVAQMERADEYVAARIENAKEYNERLKGIRGLQLPPESKDGTNVHWMYSIQVDEDAFGATRDGLIAHLGSNAIQTRTFFCPLNTMPPFKNYPSTACPVAQWLWATGLYLPSSTDLTIEEIDTVCDSIRSVPNGK